MHERRSFLPSDSGQQLVPSPVKGSCVPPPRQLFGSDDHQRRGPSFKRRLLRVLEDLEEERPVLYYTSLLVLIGGVFVFGVFAGQAITSFTGNGPTTNNNLRSSTTRPHHISHHSHHREEEEPEPIHPYKQHFPGDHLGKTFNKDYESYNETVSKDNEICFVHVGKTAGSTVGCALGFGLHCHHHNVTPGLLPQYSTRVFHTSGYDCFDDSAYYLFVVRDPLDRLVSAFNYEKPSDVVDGNWTWYEQSKKTKWNNFPKLYHDCFHSINDLGQFGLSPESNATEECKGRAFAYVEGTEMYGYHHFYNYQFHLEGVKLLCWLHN